MFGVSKMEEAKKRWGKWYPRNVEKEESKQKKFKYDPEVLVCPKCGNAIYQDSKEYALIKMTDEEKKKHGWEDKVDVYYKRYFYICVACKRVTPINDIFKVVEMVKKDE